MGFKLAEAYVEIRPQGFESVAGACARVKSEMMSVTSVAQKFSGALGVGLGNLGSQLAAGFVGNVRQAVENMIRLAAAAESTQINFATLLGDAGKAKQLLGEIRSFAAQTPLSYSGTSQAAELLLNYGVAADQIMPTIKMLGDVSGGSQQRLMSLALVFGQISQNGRLNGEDLRQLVAVGFNPLNEISKRTGESFGELRARMEQGGITAEMVRQAFADATAEGGRFHGRMNELGKSLEGVAGQLADIIEQLQTKLGESLVEGLDLKGFVKDSEKVASGVSAFVEKNQQAVNAGVHAAGAAVGFSTLRSVVSGAASVFGLWAEGMNKTGDSADQAGEKVKLSAKSVLDLHDKLALLQRRRGAGLLGEKSYGELAAKAMSDAGMDEITKPKSLVEREKELVKIGELKAALRQLDAEIADLPLADAAMQTKRDNLAATIGELTGSTQMLASARERLARANALAKSSTPEEAEVEFQVGKMKAAHATPEDIKRGREILEEAAATEKAAKARMSGESMLAELTREAGVLSKTLTPIEAKLLKLKRDGLTDEAMLSRIRAVMESNEKLEKSAKNQSTFADWADQIDVARGRIDEIDVQLRQMARDGASVADLETAAALLTEKRNAEKKSSTEFVASDQLNKTIQAAIGGGGVQERQLSALQRIHEALLASNRDRSGNPIQKGIGGALGGAGLGAFAMNGAMTGGGNGNPLAALGGENNPAAKLLGGLAGAGLGKGDQLLQRMGDLLEKNVQALTKIEKTLTGDGIRVSSIPDMVARVT